MLSFNQLIYEKEINTAEIEIQKDPKLSQEDLKDLDKLFHEFDEAELKNDQVLQSLFLKKISQKSADSNLKEWKERGIWIYVLRKRNKIIGFCTVKPKHMVLDNTALIDLLCISKNERSSGYGRYLLDYVLKDIKKIFPNKNLGINVFDRNLAAKKLYSSLGFRPGSILMLKEK